MLTFCGLNHMHKIKLVGARYRGRSFTLIVLSGLKKKQLDAHMHD